MLDDSLDTLDVIQEVLAYEHYEVRCAESSARFHEHTAEWQPDWFLLDFRLGDGNGDEICKELKANTKTCHIPVILFSAYFSKQAELFVQFKCNQYNLAT